MIDPARLTRAIYLGAKLIDASTYQVRGGVADHMVEVVDGRCYCDCVDAQVRGPGCKHSLLVRLLGGDPEVVKALRAVVPPPRRRTTKGRAAAHRSQRGTVRVTLSHVKIAFRTS